ncbi:hypothetical protein K8Q94_01465 [Candidatus Nomurabacteria bacterium]|nr:hypothetical protein [Candidatus Nomurabacteria bacterium]
MSEFAMADLTGGQLNAIVKKLGGHDGALRFLRGELVVFEVQPAPELVLDFTIQVDRTIRPTYPDWMKELKHPELELAGPASYDLQSLELWLHDKQKSGTVEGNAIYKELKRTDALENCLNLQDLLAIQAKGIETFRKLFAGKAVFAWKSVVLDRYGSLGVPCLVERDGEVVLRWRWLGDSWSSHDPALRFAK